MISFAQWWKTYSKNSKIHEHYYLCGRERVLVDDIIEQIMQKYSVHEWNLNKFVVGLHTDAEIWDSLFSASIDDSESITIVQGVEKLSNKQLLPELVRTKSSKHVVILVSNEDKIEKLPSRQDDGSMKYVLPDFLDGFERKGKIVECYAFTQSTAKTAVSWIQTKIEAQPGALVHLLNESNGDLRLVRDVLIKLKWVGEPANVRNINIFLVGEPSEEFADSLLSLDKKNAILALYKMPQSEYLQLIGHLDAQVDLAGRVHDMLAIHKSIPEIMKAVGSQAFLVPAISKVARHYSRDRRLGVRKLLAETDRRIRSGSNEGAMESLVALW